MFEKKKMSELRSERDLLLTNQGSMFFTAAKTLGAGRETDVVEKNKAMAKEIMNRNRSDHTSELIATPGYFETIGPDRIYKSVWNQDLPSEDELFRAVRPYVAIIIYPANS